MEKTRSYRNVFGQMGIPQEQIERRLEEIKNTFFFEEEERVYYPVGEDMAYIMDTGNNDARTEGMSYGMMLCVQLDMKDEFDRLWKWAKTYMWMEEGENEGYFAWSCSTDGKRTRMVRRRTGRNILRWRCFLLRTDGGTERASLRMAERPEIY